MSKLLIQSIDLDTPGLEIVKDLALANNYVGALKAWRNNKVDLFRKSNMYKGYNGSTAFSNNNYAQYMLGDIDESGFNGEDISAGFSQRKNFSSFDFNSTNLIDWFMKDISGNFIQDPYYAFNYFLPLASNYCKTFYTPGASRNISKFFDIVADFSKNQKFQFLKNKNRGIDLTNYYCDWSQNAQSTLTAAGRVENLFYGLSFFAKSLDTNKALTGYDSNNWDNTSRNWYYKYWQSTMGDPIDITSRPLGLEHYSLIPEDQLATIAFSLVFDHVDMLYTRYGDDKAVPNQRQTGLGALMNIAKYFPEFIKVKNNKEEILKSFNDYMLKAFNGDNGMLEASFNYNEVAANRIYKDLAELYYEISGEKENVDGYKMKAINYFRLMADILTPLGAFPGMSSQSTNNPANFWVAGITDADVTSIIKSSRTFKDYIIIDKEIKLITDAIIDNGITTLPYTSVNYHHSGYYVQRKEWKYKSPYLFFYNRRPSRGHYNLGSNSVQISAYGRPLLVYGGPEVYGADQLTKVFQPDFVKINKLFDEDSSLKTNTVIVDNKSQVVKTSSNPETKIPFPLRITAATLNTKEFDFLEGYYTMGYDVNPRPTDESEIQIYHRRLVTFVRDYNFWIIADVMTNGFKGLDKSSHTYSQIWNFPGFNDVIGDTKYTGIGYGFKRDQVLVDSSLKKFNTTDTTGPNVWISHFGDTSFPVTYNKYYGQGEPDTLPAGLPYRGWTAFTFGRFHPANQIFANWTSPANKNSILVTIIYPTDKNISKPAISDEKNLYNATTGISGVSMTLPDGKLLEYKIAHDKIVADPIISGLKHQSVLAIKKPSGLVENMLFTDITIYTDQKLNTLSVGQKQSTLSSESAIDVNTNIELYPNPVTSILKINSDKEINKIEIYSSLGSLLSSKKPINDSIDLSNLSSGVYYIKMYTTEGYVSKKVIKE